MGDDTVDTSALAHRPRGRWKGALLWLLLWPVGALAAGALAVSVLAITEGLSLQGSSFSDMFWDRGLVFVSGTWEIEGEQMAAPINHVEIRCERDAGVCTEAAAEVFPRLSNLLSVRLEVRPIESWTSQTIVTRNEAGCADYVMTISRATESVTALRVRRESGNRFATMDCTVLNARNEYRLIDGADRELRKSIARGQVFGWSLLAIIALWSIFVGYRISRLFLRRAPKG